MARTLSGRSPRAQQRAQELIMERAILKYRGRLSREIARAMRAAARNPLDSDAAIMVTHMERLLSILKPLWHSSVKESLEINIGGQKSFSPIAMELKADVEATPNIDKIVTGWLNFYAARKVSEIAHTTQKDISDVVANGREEGLTEIEIGKAIRAIAPFKSASRAQTIARTESHQASMVAADEVAKLSTVAGLTMRKEWVASSGERTRPDHNAANGQTVDMDQSFIVGGERLKYPGDPSGSAKQVINCRCAVVYVYE